MNSRPSRNEIIAYTFAFLLALGLRFALLGRLPLTDSEASFALQALQISQGARPALASNVAYVNLSALLFFIFGSSNFLARFWPALVGSFLSLAPALLRAQIKPRPAAILAIFLAIDPALVALSRQAGSSILVVTFAVFAVGFWLRNQPRLAGMFLALTLLSGPLLWPSLLGLLLTWMLTQFMSARPNENEPESAESSQPEAQPAVRTSAFPRLPASPFILSFVVTFFAVSTLGLFAPQGLGEWLNSLPAYLSGWVTPSTVPSYRMFLALGAYEVFALPFALIAIVRGWWNGSRRIITLSLWMLVALLLSVFYPARQPSDLVWTLLPLWMLAALELARHIRILPDDRLETAGVIIFSVLLLAFAWLDLEAMYFTAFPSPQATVRLSLFVGSILLFLVSVTLVGYGWSMNIARAGAALGASLMLGIYTLGATWGATGLRNPLSVEMWDSSPRIAQVNLLVQTADQVSEWATGDKHNLTVEIQGVDSPALLWALRYHNPQVVAALDPSSTPGLVVTPLQQSIQLGAAYRGQDFAWRQYPSWDSFGAYNLRWLTYRELPLQSESIVLWARNDLFIDAKPSTP